MKTSLFASALLILAIQACSPKVERFTVRGSVSDPVAAQPGSLVYLSGPEGAIDSTKVKDGAFSFVGAMDPARQLTVTLKYPGKDKWDDSFTVVFVPDAETICIDLDYPATVSGSPLTDEIAKFREELLSLYYDPRADLGEQEPGMDAEVQIEAERQAADSLYRVQMQKIIQFSRETYLANTGNALGRQALSLLISELPRAELDSLLALGGEAIRNDKQLRALIESKE